ncbi:MAG: hypothetical protein A2W22_00220 [Candidatus Levybacteria bacterium RBG_16_35_11]|nr:MAG: hypothetical protein A2W22_00220 [Candidatus Levybacteria bacterium RBG_16_35_11]
MWLPFSFLNAFFDSFTNVFAKRGLQKIDNLSVVWSHRFFGILILIPLAIATSSFKPVSFNFWPALIGSSIINTVTAILYAKAIKDSDLSLVLPIITLTPIFLLFTSPLILGEFPKTIGVVGIVFTVLGAYVLNFSQRKYGFFKPLISIVKESGPRLMLIIAFLWSISANLDKIAIKNSNPLLYAVSIVFVMLVLLTAILIFYKTSFKNIFRNSRILAPIGVSAGLSTFFQFFALSLTIVPNVISVKRTSAIFSVFWGKLFFKEEKIKERLIGAIVMVLGVVLIAIS